MKLSILLIKGYNLSKSILFVAAILASSAAIADSKGYADIQYYQEENRNTHVENVKQAITVGVKTDTAWDYSLKLELSQAEIGKGSISEGIEVRIKRGFALGFLKPYVGIRIGERISATTHYSHYAMDVGTKFPLVGNLSGDVGYRYRNAFDTVNPYESNRGHVALAYALTKQDSVALRYSQSYGDRSEQKDSYRLTYSRAF